MLLFDHRLAAVRRLGLVVLLLCAVICAQTVSLSAEHSHQHASQHCCGLCHTGPLPFVPMSIGAAVLPPLAVIWLASIDESGGAPERLASTESSRAPPA
jgi:hypothetical protein